VFLSAELAAQTSTAADAQQEQGAFPNAVFEANFRKYTPPANAFSPVYSWDAHMALDVTLFRSGSSAVTFATTFQSVGTENLGSKVSVGGAGYLLGLGYGHTFADHLTLFGGFGHLSTHLTRDLDDKLNEQQNKGVVIPSVDDPSEYNVVYFRLDKALPARPLAPELTMIVTPVTFRFNESDPGSVRPIHVSTRLTPWRGKGKSVAVETRHEIGPSSFNSFSLALQLFARTPGEEPFRVVVSATPGRHLHVSPHIGGLRGGIALGIGMRFR
jgi:hypothetical protein